MWKSIKISQRPFLINCNFDNDNVTFILYDHKESWSESFTLEELKRKVKLLNRRYDFNEEIIRETLGGGSGGCELESAHLEQPELGKTEKLVLKLKYRVKNCPLHFDWQLRKQTMLEFQTMLVRPLSSALIGCQEQIEILMDNLKKKDAEILQYRKEGAILSRKTLATKLFDFDEFSRKYEGINKISADFAEFGKLLRNFDLNKELVSPALKKVKESESQKPVEKVVPKPAVTPWSPGQRKRKIQELKQKHLERNIKNRKQNIEYESSQSQDTTTGSSQSSEFLFEQKNKERYANATASKERQKHTEENSVEKKSDDKVEKIIDQTKVPPVLLAQEQNKKSEENIKAQIGQEDKQILITTPTKRSNEAAPPTKSDNILSDSIEIKSDSESDDIILTPRKSFQLRKKKGKKINPDKIISDSETDDPIDSSKITARDLSKSFQEEKGVDDVKTRNAMKQKALRCLAFNEVVEISTDSEFGESNKPNAKRYPKRRNTTSTPTKVKGRVTRSSPLAPLKCLPLVRRRNSVGMMPADFKIFDSSSKKKPAAHYTVTKPVIVGEISSQLDAIRKELQSLEALRLADLKQRTCKV